MNTIDERTIITSDLLHKNIATGLPKSEKVEARKLEQLLSYENLVASYKIYWFLGIYKEILEGNKEITFKRIVCRMIANAWYPLPNPGKILTEYQRTLENHILEERVDEKYILSDDDLEKWTYMKGPKAIDRKSKEGHTYTFREGGIAFPDPKDKPARTMLTSEGSKNRSTHVVSDLETGKLRILTPLECERINGFPDNWTNI